MFKHFTLILILFYFSSGSMQGQDLQNDLGTQVDIVVAQDGSGDFTTIKDAVYSVQKYSSSRTVIFVKNGTYNEKLEIENGINKVTIVGENVDSTYLVYNDYSGSGVIYNGIISSKVGTPIGTSSSHSMYIDSDEFILMNFTVVNNAGNVGQAVAINLGGDRTILVHCRILGNQDTFYTWGYGRFLMQDCFIQGGVDFIFGRGVAVFDSCIINTNRNSCQITAASTDAGWKFGYAFRNCKITSNRGVSGVTMGRPWRENAQTVFMNCYLDKHIAPAGWSDWDGRSATCYYAEYKNYGPGSDISSRVSWSHQLSDTEAQNYTHDNMFKRDVNPSNFSNNWTPDIHNDPVYKVLKAHTSLLYLDSLQNNSDLKSITVNGIPIEDFDPLDRTYTIELPDTTTIIPSITAESLSPLTTFTIEYPQELPGYAYVWVTAINGFQTKYTIRYRLIEVGVKETYLSQALDAIVMGNPFYDNLTIKMTDRNYTGPANLSLFSVNGQLLASRTIYNCSAGEIISLDTSSVKPGLYICRLASDSKIFREKVVKE